MKKITLYIEAWYNCRIGFITRIDFIRRQHSVSKHGIIVWLALYQNAKFYVEAWYDFRIGTLLNAIFCVEAWYNCRIGTLLKAIFCVESWYNCRIGRPSVSAGHRAIGTFPTVSTSMKLCLMVIWWPIVHIRTISEMPKSNNFESVRQSPGSSISEGFNSCPTKTTQNTKWAVCGSKYMFNWILNLDFRKYRIWIVAQPRKWKCHGWGATTPCGYPARWLWGVTCIIMVAPKNLTAKRDWLVWSPPPPSHKVAIYIWNWEWVTLFLDIIGSHKTVTVHVTLSKGFCSIWCGEVGEYLLLKFGVGHTLTLH